MSQTPLLSTASLTSKGGVAPSDTRRRGPALAASLCLHLGLTMLIVFGIGQRSGSVVPQPPVPTHLVYVAEAGPGGGGGGNPAPASAQTVEIPRHRVPDPVPVDVQPPAERTPVEPILDTPIVTNAAAMLSAVGTSIGLPGPGGGSPGTGLGPGVGPGVGPGTGGGTGGGPKQIGNGVTSPIPLRSTSPTYTPEAMRAKTQGNVELEVVVRANGTVGDVRVTKSLDPGLDQEAVKCARQWLFRPGMLQGSPVDVYVTLIIEFRLH
jgi:protein TonB